MGGKAADSVWAVKRMEDLLSRIAWAKIRIGKPNLVEWWVVLLLCSTGRSVWEARRQTVTRITVFAYQHTETRGLLKESQKGSGGMGARRHCW